MTEKKVLELLDNPGEKVTKTEKGEGLDLRRRNKFTLFWGKNLSIPNKLKGYIHTHPLCKGVGSGGGDVCVYVCGGKKLGHESDRKDRSTTIPQGQRDPDPPQLQ